MPPSEVIQKAGRHSVWLRQLDEVVGAVGFEPTISCSQSTCVARLRHTPIGLVLRNHT